MPTSTPPNRLVRVARHLRTKDLFVVSLLATAVLLFRSGDGALAQGRGGVSAPAASPMPLAGPQPFAAGAVPPPLVTGVAPASYAAGSAERDVFDALNQARAQGNFGLLAQDSRLDAAAARHAAYMAQNLGGAISHRQDARLPGFTGETPAERIRAAGYAPAASFEAISSGTTAKACLQLLNTVYHLGVLMIGATDVGIAVDPAAGCVIEPQLPRGTKAMQARPAGTLGAYPYPGQADVPATFMPATEMPNPAPDLGDALAGPPILADLNSAAASGQAASDIVLARFALTEAAGGAPVEVRVLASRGVTAAPGAELDIRVDRQLVSAGQVFLLPMRPLKAATAYAVDFSGSANGITINRRWQFVTR